VVTRLKDTTVMMMVVVVVMLMMTCAGLKGLPTD
jgi:hypothetical protein